jgi:hypothetical protein
MCSRDIFGRVTQEWMEAAKWSSKYEWRAAAELYSTALNTLGDWQKSCVELPDSGRPNEGPKTRWKF